MSKCVCVSFFLSLSHTQTIRKITLYLRDMLEKHVSSELASDKTLNRMEKKASGMEALKVRTEELVVQTEEISYAERRN